jgi:CRP/FNR family transcriptional regulator, anaerobic regulatory protein
MKEIVISYLQSIHPLSQGLQQELHQSLKEATLKKKQLYLKEGEVSNKISFVISGLLRSYTVNNEGEETTCWFMKEGDVTISVKSFLSVHPVLNLYRPLSHAYFCTLRMMSWKCYTLNILNLMWWAG